MKIPSKKVDNLLKNTIEDKYKWRRMVNTFKVKKRNILENTVKDRYTFRRAMKIPG